MWLPCRNCKHDRHRHVYVMSNDLLRERLKNCDADTTFPNTCGCRNYQEMSNLEYIEFHESKRLQVVQEDLRRTHQASQY